MIKLYCETMCHKKNTKPAIKKTGFVSSHRPITEKQRSHEDGQGRAGFARHSEPLTARSDEATIGKWVVESNETTINL